MCSDGNLDFLAGMAKSVGMHCQSGRMDTRAELPRDPKPKVFFMVTNRSRNAFQS